MSDFIEWIANAVFEDDWLDNQAFYREIILRKLVKLGIVELTNGNYVLITAGSERDDG